MTHPEQFAREADRGAAWSPSGSQIVFARYGYNEYVVEVRRRVWIVYADGSGERALSAAGVFASEPAWSAGGAQVAFGAGELYVLGADATGLTQVTTTRPRGGKSEATIFSATSRAKRTSFTVTGDVRTLALSPFVAALLVEGGFVAFPY